MPIIKTTTITATPKSAIQKKKNKKQKKLQFWLSYKSQKYSANNETLASI